MRPYVKSCYTANEFLEKLGKTCGMDIARKKATNDLIAAKQGEKESIDAYHARLCALWTLTNISEEDKVEKMQDSVNFGLAMSIATCTFKSVEQLLETLRKAEYRRDEIKRTNPRNSKDKKPVGGSITHTRIRENNPATNKGRSPSANSNSRNPTATKPRDWVGTWYEPETNPAKMTDAERTQIAKQGRCRCCRGSGHFATDACCPLHNRTKLAEIQTLEELPSDHKSENSGS